MRFGSMSFLFDPVSIKIFKIFPPPSFLFDVRKAGGRYSKKCMLENS